MSVEKKAAGGEEPVKDTSRDEKRRTEEDYGAARFADLVRRFLHPGNRDA